MTTRRSFLAASTAAAAGAFISKGASAADVATTQLPAKWDAETDVLVAGSGIAGMSAAISALDKGANRVRRRNKNTERARRRGLTREALQKADKSGTSRISKEHTGTRQEVF